MTLPLFAILFTLGYTFFGYPLLLALCAGAASRRSRPAGTACEKTDAGQPLSVSVLLSVYNEEAVINRKIDNFLALAYPEDSISLFIVSDGSSDATDRIIAERALPRVTLIRQKSRKGKTAALNLAAGMAGGDILLFTDADAMLRPDSVERLLRPFADPDTGLAGGRSLYLDDAERETAGSLYRRYEEWIKEREGRLFGIAGADGALYALRRDLYSPLPLDCINDLYHPVQVVLAGKKAVAVPEALALEPADNGHGYASAFARQTRIMAQAWLIFLRACPDLIRARRWGFLWQMFSHKILRWLAMPLLVLAIPAALGATAAPATATLTGLAGLTLAAALGAMGRGGRCCRAAGLFILQSVAALAGLFRLALGERYVTWSPRGR